MRRRFGAYSLGFFLAAGCSQYMTKSMDLKPGRTKAEVQARLGVPYDRSFRGASEAWQYMGVVGFGECEYLTAWFDGDVLTSLTTRHAPSAGGCTQGSRAVDWGQYKPYPLEVKIDKTPE